ncbi:MAG: hypothetical protein EXS38_06055 [Opitutus sp.]|nr:hypothetical protein [Opitutus sp.]
MLSKPVSASTELGRPLIGRATALILGALGLIGIAGGAEVAFKFVDQKSQPVADAVVSLIALEPTGQAAPPAAPAVIGQQKQEFSPYVTAVQVGSAVDFPNRDTVGHQVYSSSKIKKFELPLYVGEAREPIVFDRPGIVAIGCNIHDWMLAYVVVLETPWFAKSAADGTAKIANAPPGRYRVEIWQPRLDKRMTRELTVTAGAAAPTAVTLELGRDRRIRRTPDAKGGGYK